MVYISALSKNIASVTKKNKKNEHSVIGVNKYLMTANNNI